jgi:hypothetical protein
MKQLCEKSLTLKVTSEVCMYSSHWSLCQQTEAEISNLTGDRAEEDR